MSQAYEIVLPVFGLIVIGYVLALTGLLRQETGDAIADFVFNVAIPILIFRIVAEADFTAASPWLIWLAFFTAYGISWIIAGRLVRSVFGRDARAGLVASVSASFGNMVLVGIPLALAAFGVAAEVPIALLVAIHLPLTMVLSSVLIERAQRIDGQLVRPIDRRALATSLAANLVKNPIVLGMAAGWAWRLTGLPLAGAHGAIVDRLADVAGTLALFAMGFGLRQYDISGNIRPGIVLTALKLILMPAAVYLLARYLIPLPPIWAKVAIVFAACPTGVNAFLVAARFRTGQALASNTIIISSALAVFTTTLWLIVAQRL